MLKKLFFLLFPIFFIYGCNTPQEKLGEVLQSHGATGIRRDFKKISEYLVSYKEKLDLRNPKAFSKESSYTIKQAIAHSHNTLRITHDGVSLKTYDDYLRIAFSKNPKIPDRNDFLIVGLHKLLYETYQIEKGHQITTLAYQQEAFKKLYYYLEVIKWKIRTAKDTNDNFLFITWQNNWQIELHEKVKKGINPTWEVLENLPSIKNGKESLFDHSNPNFEILLNHMIAHVKNSARTVGDEPVDIGLNAMISLVLFL
ncbi:MAG: hypothetical protein KBE79_05805 [Sulfurospirillum sp.]|jgi:hypothetical protein|nr:hypothetical protein [Sulfurospirillum sp.]MBP9492705.1 hypothetical protein [Sulfurospirillum sp.]MBP9613186.1 hypothetical protein [Sulfurospirillum sp.]